MDLNKLQNASLGSQATQNLQISEGLTLYARLDLEHACDGAFVKYSLLYGNVVAFFSTSHPRPDPGHHDAFFDASFGGAHMNCPGLFQATGHIFAAFVAVSPSSIAFSVDDTVSPLPLPVPSPPPCSPMNCPLIDGISCTSIADANYTFQPQLSSCQPVTVLFEMFYIKNKLIVQSNSAYLYFSTDAGGIWSVQSSQLLTLLLCPGQTLHLRVTNALRPLEYTPYPQWHVITAFSSPRVRRLPIQQLLPYSAATLELLNSAYTVPEDPSSPPLQCSLFDSAFCSFSFSPPRSPVIPWPPPPLFSQVLSGWKEQAQVAYGKIWKNKFQQSSRVTLLFWYLAPSDPDSLAVILPFQKDPMEVFFTSKLVGAISGNPLASAVISGRLPILQQNCSFDGFKPVFKALNSMLLGSLDPQSDGSDINNYFMAANIQAYLEPYRSCFRAESDLLADKDATTQVILDSALCTELAETDACCNPQFDRVSCCRAEPTTFELANFTKNQTSVDRQCKSGYDCFFTMRADMRRQFQLQLDFSAGCPAFTANARRDLVSNMAALRNCSVMAFSDDQYHPWVCQTDDDCPLGFSCRLNSCGVPRAWMEQTYVDCLCGPSSRIPIFVLQQLKANINSRSPIRTPSFVSDVTRFYQTMDCVPPRGTGIPQRHHWQFRNPRCEDLDRCNEITRDPASISYFTSPEQYNIRCLEQSCFVESDCLSPFTTCTRFWQYLTPASTPAECAVPVCNIAEMQLPQCNGSSFCLVFKPDNSTVDSLYSPSPQQVCEQLYKCPYRSLQPTTNPASCRIGCSAPVFICSGATSACGQLSLTNCSACQENEPCALDNSIANCHLTEIDSSTPAFQQLCSQQGRCGDVAWINTSYCAFPWMTDSNSLSYCAPDLILAPTGCLSNRLDSTGCEAAGGIWTPQSLERDACMGLPSTCNELPVLTLKDPCSCKACGGIPRPPYPWISNTLYAGAPTLMSTVVSEVVTQEAWTTALDVNRLTLNITKLLLIDSSNSLRSRTLCEHSTLQLLLYSFVCDCYSGGGDEDDDDNCFDFNQILYPSSATFPCPFTETRFESPPFSFVFPSTSIDLSTGVECPDFLVQYISALSLRAPQSLSTPSLFNRQFKPKDFRVSNSNNQEVGQVRGDGFLLPSPARFFPQFDGLSLNASDVYLCVDLRTDLGAPRDVRYVVPDFGYRAKNNRIYPYMLTNATYRNDSSPARICAYISRMEYEQSYFPIIRLADLADSSDVLYSTSDLGIIFTTAALYLIVLILCFIRLGQLFIYRLLFTLRIFNPLCLSVFNFFRAVYFLLLGLGGLEDAQAYVTFLLVDIPYFFWFLGMTILLWWWVALAYTADKVNLRRNFSLLVGCSSAIIGGLLVIVGVLYGEAETTEATVCGGRLPQPPDTGISQQNVILIVYKSVLAAFSLVFCILFLFTGQRLRKVAPGHIENRIVMITWVSFISFFSQSLYFVFLAGFSSGNNAFVNSVYSLIPLWFIEILPQVVMLASQKTEQKATAINRARTLSRRLSTSSTDGISLPSMEPAVQPRIITSDEQ